MIEVVAIIAGGLIAAGLIRARHERRLRDWMRTQEDIWRSALRANGLEPTSERSDLGELFLAAHRGKRRINVAPTASVGVSTALVTMDGVPRALRIWRDSLRLQVAQLADTGRVTVGDPELDELLVVEGSLPAVRAAFDAATRRTTLELLHAGPVSARNGVLWLRYGDDPGPPPLERAEYLRRALALADRLSGDQVEQRLAAIVRADPLPSVRRFALEALCAEVSGPAVRAVIEAALSDEDPQVRLTAALALGPVEGRPTLVAVASDTHASDDTCARALAVIGSSLAVAELRALLSVSLRERRVATAEICVDLLDRAGGGEPDVLVHLLERGDGALVRAAVRALGGCGTAEHVPALRDAESGAVGFSVLASACRSAIAAIQERAQGAMPGQLSLASDGGAMSLTDDVDGRLELTKAGTRPSSAED